MISAGTKRTILTVKRKLELICLLFNSIVNFLNFSYKIKMNKLLNDDDDAPGPMEYHLESPDRDVSMLSSSQFSV